MLKTVTSGERSATVILDGTECEVRFSSGYNVVSVRAEGDTLIALDSGKADGDDGTVICKAGGTVMYPHMRNASSVFLTGTGKAEIIVSNEAVNPFKSAPVSGGGGGAKIMTAEEWEASSKKDMGYVAVIQNEGFYNAGVLYNTDINNQVWFDNGIVYENGFDPYISTNYVFVSNVNQTKIISVNTNNQIEVEFRQNQAASCSICINYTPIDVTAISKVIFDVDYDLSPNQNSLTNSGTSFAFCVSPNNNIGTISGDWTPSGYNNFTEVSYVQNPNEASEYTGHSEMELDVSELTGNVYFYICHIKAQPVVSENYDYIRINSIIAV